MSKYDIVLFGATGFTGKYVAKELAKKFRIENFTWAIAGRSESKLKTVLNSISTELATDLNNVESMVVSVDDQESIIKMCKKAKLIINCVGPYRFYGEPIVKECVKSNTHHLDVSGEPEFLERMQLNYDEEAKTTNTFIVGSCGVDSIPADLGVFYTKNQFNGDLNSVDAYWIIKQNGGKYQFNYATWVSLVHGLSSAKELSSIRKKLFKSKLKYSDFRPENKGLYFHNDYLKKWVIPFPGSDKSVVQRTQHFNYYNLKERPILFNPYFTLEKLSYVYQVLFWGFVAGILTKYKTGRSLLLKYYKFFGRGMFSKGEMTFEQLNKITFEMYFIGNGWSKKLVSNEKHTCKPDSSIITRISGPEPNYDATARIVTNCAIILLREKNKIPVKGGVITPTIAFSKTSLLERLKKEGILFETIKTTTKMNST